MGGRRKGGRWKGRRIEREEHNELIETNGFALEKPGRSYCEAES